MISVVGFDSGDSSCLLFVGIYLVKIIDISLSVKEIQNFWFQILASAGISVICAWSVFVLYLVSLKYDSCFKPPHPVGEQYCIDGATAKCMFDCAAGIGITFCILIFEMVSICSLREAIALKEQFSRLRSY